MVTHSPAVARLTPDDDELREGRTIKRRSVLLCCAAAVIIASVTTSARPVAAAPPEPPVVPPTTQTFVPVRPVIVVVGYIISCVAQQLRALPQPVVTLPQCVNEAIRNLAATLELPVLPSLIPTSTRAATSSLGSTTPNVLNVPASIEPILKSLPAPLRTTPLANAAPIVAPVRDLAPSPARPDSTSAAGAPTPKHPTVLPIRLATLADNRRPASSSNPISTGDVLAVAVAGLLVAAGIRPRVRAVRNQV